MLNDSARPWEAPGSFRRDCEPHRGELLLFLGTVSFICGLLSLCLFLPSVIGLPLGIAVLILVRRDSAQIDAGRMDPRGKEALKLAKVRSIYGIEFSAIAALFALCILMLPEIARILGF